MQVFTARRRRRRRDCPVQEPFRRLDGTSVLRQLPHHPEAVLSPEVGGLGVILVHPQYAPPEALRLQGGQRLQGIRLPVPARG